MNFFNRHRRSRRGVIHHAPTGAPVLMVEIHYPVGAATYRMQNLYVSFNRKIT
jgi:hypothetical protein